MILGILMLLFIGFQRISQMAYIRTDVMLCGIMRVAVLPVVSTFWRYLKSLTIVQSNSILRLSSELRARVWKLLRLSPSTNTHQHRLRRSARFMVRLKARGRAATPSIAGSWGCVRIFVFSGGNARISLRNTTTRPNHHHRRGGQSNPVNFAVCCRHACGMCMCAGTANSSARKAFGPVLTRSFTFTFGNRVCAPAYANDGWYSQEYDYNETWQCQPQGWDQPCRLSRCASGKISLATGN